MINRTAKEELIWNDIFSTMPIPSYVKGRIILLGDAAHAPTPDIGQGAAQSFEDAAILSSLLSKRPFEQGLEEYDRIRVPRTHEILKKLAQWENPIAVWLHNMLGRVMPKTYTERQMESIFNVNIEPVRARYLHSDVSH